MRDPAAVVALGDFGGGRLAVQQAGAPRAEVLARHGNRLDVVATLAAAPVCAWRAAGSGAFAPDEGLLRRPAHAVGAIRRRARARSPLFAVSAAPHPGPIAYAALDANLRLELLGPDLQPAGPGLPGVGVGFALADLDGDGTAEVVASSPLPSADDRVRVFAPRAERPLLFESGPMAGAILAGAGGDLTGDGVDDAVLALVSRGPDGAWTTELLLVTADAREMR